MREYQTLILCVPLLRIVEAASVFFKLPLSAVTLLDKHRQWFKAEVGYPRERGQYRGSQHVFGGSHQKGKESIADCLQREGGKQ